MVVLFRKQKKTAVEEDAMEMLLVTARSAPADGSTAADTTYHIEWEETEGTSSTSNSNLQIYDTGESKEGGSYLQQAVDHDALVAEEPETNAPYTTSGGDCGHGDADCGHGDADLSHDDPRESSIMPGYRHSAFFQFSKMPRASRRICPRRQQINQELEERENGFSDKVELLQEDREEEERVGGGRCSLSRLKSGLYGFKKATFTSLKMLKGFFK